MGLYQASFSASNLLGGTFNIRYVQSGTTTSGGSGLRAGWYSSSGAEEYIGLLYGTLPEKEAIYGAGVTDPNLAITKLSVVITPSTADNDSASDQYYAISELSGSNHPDYGDRVLANTPVWDGISRDATGATGTMQWRGTSSNGAITTAGVISDTLLGWGRMDTTGAHEIPLNFAAKSFTWGDKFAFAIRKEGTATNDNEHFIATNVAIYIQYEDPEPSLPVIKLEADTDYRSSIVTMTTKPTEKDIIEFATVWKDGGTDTFENKVGVFYSATNRVQHGGGSQFATGIFKEVDGDIASGFLDDEGETDNLVVWASDMSASGTNASAVNRTMSNRVAHARMSCTGSISPSPPTIGQEATLTISGFSDAANSSAKSFKKFGVNWDGNSTAANDNINDYTIVTLDSETTSTTVKHTFHKNATYNINICVIDELGFRSDFTQAASITVAASNPVAVLRSSRDTAVRARYGDDFSVVNLSLSHSYPIGSDKELLTYKFKHNNNSPITTFPMDNDNSNFNNDSRPVAVRCSTASCTETKIKVYGKVSVDSDGDPIADDNIAFDHYEYQVNEVSPHTNKETIGGFATTTDSTGATVPVYYKQVDFAVISDLSGDDDGALYTLVDIKHDHSSGEAADAGYGNVINNKIRGKKDTYAWGGYEILTTGITELNFNTGAKTITRDLGSGDFLTNGAAVGDTIYIYDAEDSENVGFFTVNSVTGTVLTVNEDITTNTADTSAVIYKIGPSVLPVASYDDIDVTITGSVMTTGLAASSEVTQDISFISEEINTLDLDTTADAGDIAILSASLSRSGGMAAEMPLGSKFYPIGAVRTRMGNPSLSVDIRALTQAGYRKLWNLIEGSKYEWVTIDSKKVDAPSTAYKQLRMRLVDGSLQKDPSMASQYVGTLNFVVIGELVT